MQSNDYSCQLLVWHFDFARVNAINDIMRRLPIDCAPDALGGPQNLLCATSQVL